MSSDILLPKTTAEAVSTFVSFALWLGRSPFLPESFPHLALIHTLIDNVGWRVPQHPNVAKVMDGDTNAALLDVDMGDYTSADMTEEYDWLRAQLASKTTQPSTSRPTAWLRIAAPEMKPFYYNFLHRFAGSTPTLPSPDQTAVSKLAFACTCEVQGQRQSMQLVFSMSESLCLLHLPSGDVHQVPFSSVQTARGPLTSCFQLHTRAKITLLGRTMSLGLPADAATRTWLCVHARRLWRLRVKVEAELSKYTHVRSPERPRVESLSDAQLLAVDLAALLREIGSLKERLAGFRPDVAAKFVLDA